MVIHPIRYITMTDTMKTKLPKTGFYWHVHHADNVAEYTRNIQERITYIMVRKDPWERERRLSLLRPVKNVPPGLKRALKEGSPLRWIDDHAYTMKLLHRRECGCPFYEQWRNIFTDGEVFQEHAPAWIPTAKPKPVKPRKKKKGPAK